MSTQSQESRTLLFLYHTTLTSLDSWKSPSWPDTRPPIHNPGALPNLPNWLVASSSIGQLMLERSSVLAGETTGGERSVVWVATWQHYRWRQSLMSRNSSLLLVISEMSSLPSSR